MNILILIKNSEAGGVTSCSRLLFDALYKYYGITPVVGMCEGDGIEKFFSDVDVNIIDFNSKNFFSVYAQLSRLCKENQIDIIHAQNRVPALYSSVYCFFHRKVKYLWANHQVPIPYDLIHRLTTRYGFCAVAEGIDGERMLIKDLKIPKSKVRIINMGTDVEALKKTAEEEQRKLKKKLGIESDEKAIFLYGRMIPSKGHLFLLEALDRLSKYGYKYKVIFPGGEGTYKDEVIEMAKRYALFDRLIFPGFVDGREYLSIADLMVLPSSQEGFGLVNIDAFAMGVPVIRTKTAGYEDMKEYCTGVKYGDTEDLAERLKLFFDGDSVYEEKAAIAKKDIMKFSTRHMADEYMKLYGEMTGGE